MRLMLAAILLVASITGSPAQDAVLSEGRERSEAFLQRDFRSTWEAMTPEMREALGSLDALSKFRDELERTYGAESEILDEEVRRVDGHDIYLRTARWRKAEAPLLMQWAFDETGKVAGFFVRPAPVPAESRFPDYRTKASLRLPFEGEWFVFWGGRTLEQNYHVSDKAQRSALDFVVMEDGSSHRGDPADLGSYFCWDRPVLAPADGAVAVAVDGLPDQPIGKSDPQNPAGNHVVLDLGHSEFAFLAHLKEGSVMVEEGEAVTQGDVLGRCGNSGNTSEPHLHFHLQTTPDLATGEGLPAQFEDYVADGVPVERGEAVKGQIVAPRQVP
jgi:murein DD-endopeptidase MepM/ murein hydrolase activator NlpD